MQDRRDRIAAEKLRIYQQIMINKVQLFWIHRNDRIRLRHRFLLRRKVIDERKAVEEQRLMAYEDRDTAKRERRMKRTC